MGYLADKGHKFSWKSFDGYNSGMRIILPNGSFVENTLRNDVPRIFVANVADEEDATSAATPLLSSEEAGLNQKYIKIHKEQVQEEVLRWVAG